MAQSQPKFAPGDRVYSHYTMSKGTVRYIDGTRRNQTHGVTGDRLPDTTWYMVVMDDGTCHLLDDAHGDWDMARIIPLPLARKLGYIS